MEYEETKPTRTVKIRVWTDSLRALQITPISRERACEYFKMDKDGDLDLDDLPEEFFDEFYCNQTFYFCKSWSDVLLTVVDGAEEQQFNNLPSINMGYDSRGEYVSKFKTLEELLDDCKDYGCDDDDTKEYIEIWKCIRNIRSNIKRSSDNDDDNKLEILLSSLKQLEDDQPFNYANYIAEEVEKCNNNSEYNEGINYAQCGSIGKGKCHFNIKIPEGVPFDINKLHFIAFEDWLYDDDTDFGWFDEYREAFRYEYTSLMFVEYDGCIYPMDYPEFLPGWKYCNGFFINNYLIKLDTLDKLKGKGRRGRKSACPKES